MASLLSYLLAGSEQEEVYATNALTYLLEQRRGYADALLSDWAKQTGAVLPQLSFVAEMRADEGRCDIVGQDLNGVAHLMVEGKFWAALTDNQPVTYLTSLRRATDHGLLMFVVPRARFETVWPELLRRANANGHAFEGRPVDASHLRFARLRTTGCVLGITSWSAVLNALEAEAVRAADAGYVSDVQQLGALCERMDTTGFLPLKSSDLNSTVGRRHLELRMLLDDLHKRLMHSGVASKNPGTVKSGDWWPMLLAQRRAYLRFWVQGWATHRQTPCWLVFPKTGDNLLSAEELNCLQRLAHETPSRLVSDREYWFVPLFPTIGIERDGVIADLHAQVAAVVSSLVT
jgi:hypothetical protein